MKICICAVDTRLIEKYHVTALDAAPSALKMLLKLSKGEFWKYAGGLKYIEIGTAALPEELKKQLIFGLPNVRLYNFYGSTESGRSCVLEFSAERNKPNCIGKPSKNSTIIFTDDNRHTVIATKANPGLLASSGSMNMECYWKNPELTASIMKDNFLFSNDIGYSDEEGYIYIIGRKDDVINYNGIKISPLEIEEIAIKYQNISEAICVGKKSETAGTIPVLFIVLEKTAGFDLEDYLKYLSKSIDKNKIPQYVNVIQEIPRTYNGKVDRKKLEERTQWL